MGRMCMVNDFVSVTEGDTTIAVLRDSVKVPT